MIRVQLLGVRVEFPTNQPIVLLREDAGDRSLPIFIGNPEATAIVHAMQGIATPRPMTHDLLKNMMQIQGLRLTAVEITELHERTFHAALVLESDETVQRLDARPSDAIALAVRFGIDTVAIYVDDAVLDRAGVVIDDDDETMDPSRDLSDDQIAEFRSFLDQVTPEDFA